VEGRKPLVNSDLIKRCQQGDLHSFSELYALYSKKALATAALISGSRGIAQDIVQEAFIQCFDRIKDLHDPERFDPWFYRILVRTGWGMVKKQAHAVPVDDDRMDTLITATDPHSGLDDYETSLTVREALEKLSLPLKTVVVLHYFNDLSIKDIAGVLGCFQGTVKSRLHHARRELFYELYGDFDEDERQETGLPMRIEKGVDIDGKHA
jgi:RNA polymerase sigma-70 factor (ECF subfamily)